MNKMVKIVYIMTSCKNLGPVYQTLNIIKNLDQKIFEPILITIYDEDLDSLMAKYLPYVTDHHLVKLGKKDILLGNTTVLKNILIEINPDIIHTVGVFPDYAVSRIGRYRQIFTLRNYIYDDYLPRFGKVKGIILANLQLYSMKHACKVVACSESLSRIYKEKLRLNYDFICNGVDIDQYVLPADGDKENIRSELKLPQNAFIFVYTGQFIERKNIPFMLENYARLFGDKDGAYLLLLGDGPELEELRKQYNKYKQIDFRGIVSNVNHYLKACDVFVSTSKSEGLPNSVLEAMATGLPVILSDIEQHKEIFKTNNGIGFLYKQKDGFDLIDKLKSIYEGGTKKAGMAAYQTAHENFSATKMSLKYQKVYKSIVEK